MYMWAEARTGVVSSAELLLAFVSGSLLFTVAVLFTLFAYTTLFRSMVIVALAPEARLPTEQVTVPAEFVQPELADTKVTMAGADAWTVITDAADVPFLAAKMV